jgi:hypothetical protein
MTNQQLEAKVEAQGIVLAALLAAMTSTQRGRALKICLSMCMPFEDSTETHQQVFGARIQEEVRNIFGKGGAE